MEQNEDLALNKNSMATQLVRSKWEELANILNCEMCPEKNCCPIAVCMFLKSVQFNLKDPVTTNNCGENGQNKCN